MFVHILCLAWGFSQWPKPPCPQLVALAKSVFPQSGVVKGCRQASCSLLGTMGLLLRFSFPSLKASAASKGAWTALDKGREGGSGGSGRLFGKPISVWPFPVPAKSHRFWCSILHFSPYHINREQRGDRLPCPGMLLDIQTGPWGGGGCSF